MSGWIDIRERKPTEADADKEWQKGRIFVVYGDDSTMSADWDWEGVYVAWMPIPEFTPLPDPPKGWRYVQAGESFDSRAKFSNRYTGEWEITTNTAYDQRLGYIVPIDPPEPTYRPFANAAEFDPFALKLWRLKTEAADTRRRPSDYNDRVHGGRSWKDSLDCKIFCDGTPFGVKVEG